MLGAATARCRIARRSSPIATTSGRGSGSPTRSTPETVLRGGYGISYVHFHRAGGANVLPINGPQVINAVVEQTPTQADFRTTQQGYPAGLTDPSRFNPLLANITYMPEDYHSSRVQSWFVSVQRELWRGALVDLAYIGNRADDLLLFANLNQAAPNNSAGTLSLQARRPIPEFGDITYSFNGGKSRYHAFQGKFDWRMGAGFSILNSLTLVADQGQRRRLARERQRQLPGAAELLQPRGRLRLSARITSRTTTPPASSSTCRSARGRRYASNASPAVDAAHRRLADRRRQQHLRRRAGDPHLHAGGGVPGVGHPAGLPRRQQLPAERHRRGAGAERSAHGAELVQPQRRGRPDRSEPAVRQRRRATRIAGPMVWQVDLAASKRFPLPWRTSNFEFRAEFFNLFNRTNFRAPNGNRSNAAFGTITATYDPRIIQFGLKLNF